MKNNLFFVVILLIITLFSHTAQAQWTGDGTEANPYQIQTTADLLMLSDFVANDPNISSTIALKNSYGKYWKLMNNIDMSVISEYIPIGNWDTYAQSFCYFFAGTLDGNHKQITFLSINHTDRATIGLFGYAKGATLTDIILKNVQLSYTKTVFSTQIGSLIGIADSCKISNCHVSEGTITTTGNANYGYGTGGLIGSCLNTIIKNCSYSGTLNMSKGNPTIGGLIGQCKKDTVENCYSIGEIFSSAGAIMGGLIGRLENRSFLNNSYFRGFLSGGDLVGGLVGDMSANLHSIINNCYTQVTRPTPCTGNEQGLLVGSLFSHDTVTNCYYTNMYNCPDIGQNVEDFQTTFSKTIEDFLDSTIVAFPSVSGNSLNYGQSEPLSWQKDFEEPVNEGFPILFWQTPSLYGINIFDASHVKKTEATLSGSAISKVGNFSEIGFQWKESESNIWINIPLVYNSDSASLSTILTEIIPNIQYDARIYVILNSEYYYSNIVHFHSNSYWNGIGNEAEPYLIYSDSDLIALSSFIMTDSTGNVLITQKNSYNHYWKLMNDIDMGGITDFTPIGGWSNDQTNGFYNFFAGSFDGNGHVITNLVINRAQKSYVGLFGLISNSKISNLGITNSTMTGGQDVGGLIGLGKGKDTVSGCFACCNVKIINSGQSMYYACGGLVGTVNSGSFINNCYARSNVSGQGSYCCTGGLFGTIGSSTISNCYAASSALSNSSGYKGVFTGTNGSGNSMINNYYATNLSVSAIGRGTALSGGVYGRSITVMKDSTMVAFPGTANYSLNYNQSLPLPWQRDYDTPVNSGFPILYWQKTDAITTIISSIDSITRFSAYVTGHIIVNRDSLVHKGFQYRATNTSEWTVVPILGELPNDGYIHYFLTGLSSGTNYYVKMYAGTETRTFTSDSILFTTTLWEGIGSGEFPFLIYTVEDLILLSDFVRTDPNNTTTIANKNSYGKYWKLMNNIDMSDITGFIPIGGWSNATTNSSTKFFAGTFDGNGKTINQLTLSKPTLNYVALFGLTKNATIQHLTVSNVNMTGVGYVGALVAYHSGNIYNCSSSGSVKGTSNTTHTGGLLGSNAGEISNCHSSSSIIITLSLVSYSSYYYSYVGGLIGEHTSGSITNCYATGSITTTGDHTDAYLYAGGLIGYLGSNSPLTKSYSTGSVDVTATVVYSGSTTVYVGGLVGYGLSAISQCYNYSSVTGRTNYSGTDFCVGGLIGRSLGAISNCYSRGSVSATSHNSLYVGGLAGRSSGITSNCYASHTSLYGNSATTTYKGLFVGSYSSLVNNYYRTMSGSDGTGSGSATGLTAKSNSELLSSAMVSFPGSAGNSLNYNQSSLPWTTDIMPNINAGYPILLWQQPLYVVTGGVSNLTQTTATLNGTASGGVNPIIYKGFEWKASTTSSWNKISITASVLTHNLTDLTPNTSYQVRAFAMTETDTTYGSILTFTTLAITPPIVSTNPISNLTQTTATLNGSVTQGYEPIIDNGFEWKPATEYTWNSISISSSILTHNLTDLTPNTSYQVRAFAVTETDTTYGAIVTFTTLAITPPPVSTNPISNLTQTTATLNGSVTQGYEPIIDNGFEWKPAAEYTWNSISISSSVLTHNLTDLTPNTSYIVRAFAVTETDTTYGSIVTFSTLAITPPTVSTNPISNLTQTTATLNGSVTQGYEPIIDKGFEWKSAAEYTWNSISISSSILTHNLTDLIPNTSYQVRAFAITESNTTYGSIVPFATLSSGIDDISMGNHNFIVIYPNPTLGQVTISYKEFLAKVKISISDMKGALLWQIESQNITPDTKILLDLSTWSKGVYFVKIENKQVYNIQKLIVF
ncbi:MAG: T9SS type A sorting domain-containing protein [Bacteroidales bacterium]|jgi:hypothetical protein|nr:T9SS type A sorting domain-containing protein [Bacteroidales bacterium]